MMFAPLPGAVFLQETLQTTLSENATVILLTIYVLMLAIFLGFELIGRVPATLHTPLMSGTNAIHGIVVLGAMIIMGSLEGGSLLENVLIVLAFLALILGAANVVGGFVVTDRMLEMFKRKPAAGKGTGAGGK
ncbi:MAG: transhydrogenase subunit alpha [Thermomicrobiales bacterium]|jgi:NAD(P) transhydrogenase subunit alpha|nr:transhydrogenase subunit alpha [Thermomicrobiales bacterium]MDF3038323.1 transhydrogenase subunit alpha [Thermomicrobiales bacterium]